MKSLAWNRRDIWSLSDCNGTQTHNNLVCKQTLNHLVKLTKGLRSVVSTHLYGKFDCVFITSQKCFRVNLHSVVAWMWRNALLKTGAISIIYTNPVAVTSTSNIAPVLSKEFLDIQVTTECRFTIKRVCDMIKTYSQMAHTDKYSQDSSVNWISVGLQTTCLRVQFPL